MEVDGEHFIRLLTEKEMALQYFVAMTLRIQYVQGRLFFEIRISYCQKKDLAHCGEDTAHFS